MRKTAYPGYHDLYYPEESHFNDQIKENEISGHAVHMDGNRNRKTNVYQKT